jgi:3-oxoacyl-[acyl-carrier protein] reductase
MVDRPPAALVTGGSSGIGRAIAADLLEQGFGVSIVARDPARAGLTGAHAIALDLARADAAPAAVSAHIERFGQLDVLVNAAGTARPERVSEVTGDAFEAQVALNLRATIAVCTEALPQLRASRGLIVNVASILGLHGDPTLAVYSATKALRADGVRVTALCPGYVATPFTDRVQERVPAGQMVQPADCARAVRMLLELSPSTFVPELVLDRLGSAGARLHR